MRTNTYTYTYYFRRRKQDKKYTFVVLRFTFDLIATVAFLQGVYKVGIRESFILKTTSILLFQAKQKDNQIVLLPLDKNLDFLLTKIDYRRKVLPKKHILLLKSQVDYLSAKIEIISFKCPISIPIF